MSTIVLPGEHIPAQHVNLKLGPGLLQLGGSGEPSIISTKAGTLNHSANRSKWWVENNSRRVREKKIVVLFAGCSLISLQYVPAPQESVVGAIIGKLGEGFKVDIGAAHPALLDGLAFEGATKRNKPNLKVSTSSIASYVHS